MPGAIWDDTIAEDLGTRPSVYVNFESTPPPPPVPSADGVVYYITQADWGPEDVGTEITSPLQVNRFLGTSVASVPRRAILDALAQGARAVYFHRIATSSSAKATLTLLDGAGSPAAALTINAKYTGTFGNGLKAEVVTNVADGSLRDLNIYEGTIKRETFTGNDNDAIIADWGAKGSDYVDVVLAGTTNRTPANISATSLTGGNSGSGTVAGDYTAALATAEAALFRVLAVDTVDTSIQASIRTWIIDQRNGGNRVKAVLAPTATETFANLLTQAAALNSEGVSFLVSGAVKGAITRDPVEMSLVIAAVIAVRDTASVTNFTLPGYTATQRRFSPVEYRSGLQKGLLILSQNSQERVYIEQGLNTLQPSSQVAPKNADWRKIRFIAIQDELVDRIGDYFQTNYIGKVSNDSRGRDEAVIQAQQVLDQMVRDRLLLTGLEEQANGTFLDVTPRAYLDTRYLSTADRVFVAVTGKAVDAIEKFFLTVTI